jgi:hypothetical protein
MAMWSTALRNYTNHQGSVKNALAGGKFCLYQGTIPTSADNAIVGTLLTTCTTGSATLTPAVAPRWTIVGDADGTGIVTINALAIHAGTVAATGTTAGTLTAIANAINAYNGPIPFRAWSSGTTLYIEGPAELLPVATTNAWAIAESGTMTITSANTAAAATAGSRAGVASINGLQFTGSTAGVLSTAGVWSGTNAATGTANFFVYYANPTDDSGVADATPYHCRRIIGSCGTYTGVDYLMKSTSLVAAATHTVDTSTLTMDETE